MLSMPAKCQFLSQMVAQPTHFPGSLITETFPSEKGSIFFSSSLFLPSLKIELP